MQVFDKIEPIQRWSPSLHPDAANAEGNSNATVLTKAIARFQLHTYHNGTCTSTPLQLSFDAVVTF